MLFHMIYRKIEWLIMTHSLTGNARFQEGIIQVLDSKKFNQK
jgi:hypothetical protein